MNIPHSNDIAVYKASDIFSYIMNRYIETYDDYIYKDDRGKYVFTKVMASRDIQTNFDLFFTELVNSDKLTLGNQKTVIVAGTYPFLDWRRIFYDKLETDSFKQVIKKQLLLNYVLTDRSIKIDETHLCKQFNEWINNNMTNPDKLADYTNVADNIQVVFNRNTSELDLINIVKGIFGSSRVRVGDVDCIKTIGELGGLVYNSISENELMPTKVIQESAFYMKMQFGIEPEPTDEETNIDDQTNEEG